MQIEKYSILSLMLVAAASPSTVVATDPLLMHPEGRINVSLDGEWQTIIDPYDNGYQDYRSHPNPDGYFKNARPTSPSDLIEYDFERSPTLRVPGDWNHQRESLLFYEGTLWYKRSFDWQRQEGSRVFAYFGAANYESRVFLNGELLGTHEGGFTPFNFEITDRLREGENFLIVQVDNRRSREGVPTLNTDWWNYGGLTRSVRLITVPQTFVRSYHVQLARGSRERLTGWVRLDGPESGAQTVTVQIPQGGIEISTETDADGLGQFDRSVDLELWSPENPRRYRVFVAGGGDRVEEEIGFRSLATRGSQILLNGEPIFLRGISLHEEAPWRIGRAYSREDAAKLLDWARELGANFVRLAHYPHNAAMIEEAERLGLLVWAEVPVYWTIDFTNLETWQNAAAQLTAMIERDRNRAAIVLWSVGNETPVHQERTDFMRRLLERARQLDPTRLLTAAMERGSADEETFVIDDPLGNWVDVIGCNEYVGWYDGLPEKIDRIRWRVSYEKPVVISEFGAGALAGKHGSPEERWTEEFQADLYRRQIEMLRQLPFLAGMSPWILVDFRSPRRPLPEIQDFWNRKGLVSDRGEKKEAFFVLQSFYDSLQNAPRASQGRP